MTALRILTWMFGSAIDEPFVAVEQLLPHLGRARRHFGVPFLMMSGASERATVVNSLSEAVP